MIHLNLVAALEDLAPVDVVGCAASPALGAEPVFDPSCNLEARVRHGHPIAAA